MRNTVLQKMLINSKKDRTRKSLVDFNSTFDSLIYFSLQQMQWLIFNADIITSSSSLTLRLVLFEGKIFSKSLPIYNLCILSILGATFIDLSKSTGTKRSSHLFLRYTEDIWV